VTETPAPVAGATPFLEQARLHLARWWGSDFRHIHATVEERARLASAPTPIAEPAVQDYLAWRRSMALGSLVLAVVAVLHAVIDAAGAEEGQPGVVTFIGWATASSRGVLAVALLRAAWGWAAPAGSRRQLRWAWAVALLVPVLCLQLPLADLYVGEDPSEESGLVDPQAAQERQVVRDVLGTLFGLAAFLLAIPGLTSMFPGAIRAGLLVKTLLPGRSMGAVVATFLAPIYALLLLVLLTFFQQVGGSGLLLVGALLLFAGPLLAMRPGWQLVGPLTAEAAVEPMRRYRLFSRASTFGGLGLVVIGLFTMRIFTIRVAGTGDAIVGLDDMFFLVAWFVTTLGAYTIVSADALLEGMTKADAVAARARESAQFAADTATLARLEAAIGEPSSPPAA
jgi:hypothetical protein